MKKKVYIAPVCEVVEMELETQILASSNDITFTPGEEDDVETHTNRHRGEWGNLWGRGE